MIYLLDVLAPTVRGIKWLMALNAKHVAVLTLLVVWAALCVKGLTDKVTGRTVMR